jgi:ribose 5-phosphate isomerase B
MMRIAIGCDHRGRALKKAIKGMLVEMGHECADMGVHRAKSVDYPDIAAKVTLQVSKDKADRGILICGTGIGMCISANKVQGIRAANCNGIFSARRSREHNDANVLCLGSDILGEALALDIVKTYLSTKFAGERHQRRLDKISALERKRIR